MTDSTYKTDKKVDKIVILGLSSEVRLAKSKEKNVIFEMNETYTILYPEDHEIASSWTINLEFN